jgi:hypothetical protein
MSNRDENAHNARLPVITARLMSRDEWLLIVGEAQRRGVSVSTYLRTVALEGVRHDSEQINRAPHRTLATARRA